MTGVEKGRVLANAVFVLPTIGLYNPAAACRDGEKTGRTSAMARHDEEYETGTRTTACASGNVVQSFRCAVRPPDRSPRPSVRQHPRQRRPRKKSQNAQPRG